MALTALHLWPPHTLPMCPGALFKLISGLLSSCLVKAVEVLFCSSIVALFGCGSHAVALPCLADCFLCLVLDLLPWTGQNLAVVTVTRADPDVTSQLDLVTRGFPGVDVWQKLVLPGACPALLAEAGQGQWLLRSQPHIPCGAASPVVSNTWKLGKHPSDSFTAQFFFLHSGEIGVINKC